MQSPDSSLPNGIVAPNAAAPVPAQQHLNFCDQLMAFFFPFQGPSSLGYFCPQCRSKYCELPIECKVCSLTLVSAPHLARSYHHLFPLEAFKEVPIPSSTITPAVQPQQQEQPPSLPSNSTSSLCFSCQSPLSSEKAAYQCTKCSADFCTDCDLFIHESLHTCPKCACSRDQMFKSGKMTPRKGK